jgi:hypothetical protein
MDTVRVDICYRPLRIAWAIHSTDRTSFRRAMKFSHALFGGRFNPIVLVDRPEAADLVELFRCDMVMPLGESSEVTAFLKRFPHLINPLFVRDVFTPATKHDRPTAYVLDIHNALVHWQGSAEWNALTERGLRKSHSAETTGSILSISWLL